MHRSARYQARGRRSRSVPAFQGTQTHSRTPPPHCRRLPQAAPVDEGRQIRHPHPKFLMAVWPWARHVTLSGSFPLLGSGDNNTCFAWLLGILEG